MTTTREDRALPIDDETWRQLAALFPKERQRRRGRPWRSHRQILEGIFWALNSNEPWRQMPEHYGPWQTIYDRWVRWGKDGTMARIFALYSARLNRCEFHVRQECAPRGGMSGERFGFCSAAREEEPAGGYFRRAA